MTSEKFHLDQPFKKLGFQLLHGINNIYQINLYQYIHTGENVFSSCHFWKFVSHFFSDIVKNILQNTFLHFWRREDQIVWIISELLWVELVFTFSTVGFKSLYWYLLSVLHYLKPLFYEDVIKIFTTNIEQGFYQLTEYIDNVPEKIFFPCQ